MDACSLPWHCTSCCTGNTYQTVGSCTGLLPVHVWKVALPPNRSWNCSAQSLIMPAFAASTTSLQVWDMAIGAASGAAAVTVSMPFDVSALFCGCGSVFVALCHVVHLDVWRPCCKQLIASCSLRMPTIPHPSPCWLPLHRSSKPTSRCVAGRGAPGPVGQPLGQSVLSSAVACVMFGWMSRTHPICVPSLWWPLFARIIMPPSLSPTIAWTFPL